MIIEETLRQRYEGVKNEEGVWITPAFPKLIYVLEEDNIAEGAQYYYLTRAGGQVHGQAHGARLHLREDHAELKVDNNGEGHCYTCMGCRSFLTPYVDPENGQAASTTAASTRAWSPSTWSTWRCPRAGTWTSSGRSSTSGWSCATARCMCRHNRLKGTLSDAAPILWQYGALARLKKGETIDKLLYGGYSTISLGYAGLYECVQVHDGQEPHRPGAPRRLPCRLCST